MSTRRTNHRKTHPKLYLEYSAEPPAALRDIVNPLHQSNQPSARIEDTSQPLPLRSNQLKTPPNLYLEYSAEPPAALRDIVNPLHQSNQPSARIEDTSQLLAL